MNLQLNDNIDTEKLRTQFKQTKNIIIENFLAEESAINLYKYFAKKMPEDWWATSFRASGTKDYSGTTVIRRFKKNLEKINSQYPMLYKALSRGQFAYIFDRTTKHVKGCNCPKCQYEKFISSKDVLEILNYISNEDCTKRGEFFASRFTSGQFLGPHHDINKGKLGMVYSLAKDWRPEYGGNLYILEKDYKTVKKVILSTFNRLALFSIPEQNGIPHFVSQVVPKVNQHRISITGWLS